MSSTALKTQHSKSDISSSSSSVLPHAPTPVISNRAPKHEPPPIPVFSSTETVIVRRPERSSRSILARIRSGGSCGEEHPVGMLVEFTLRSLALSSSPISLWLWRSLRPAPPNPRVKTSPSQHRLQRRIRHHRPNGIPNYGQTCFLNANLQALAACESPVTDYLASVRSYSATATQLLDVLTELSSSSSSDKPRMDPRPLLAVTRLSRHQQHDAEECLGAILSAIAEEIDWNAYELEQCRSVKLDDEEEERIVFPKIRRGKAMEDEEAKEIMMDEPVEGDVDVGISNVVQANIRVNLSDSSSSTESLSVLNSTKPAPLSDTASKTTFESAPIHEDEKKQEECVTEEIPQDSTYRPTTFYSAAVGPVHVASTIQPMSFSRMMTAPKARHAAERQRWSFSSATPTPLSGWMGSRLTCQTCHTTRPILHQPFLNLPIAPTAPTISACLSQAVASEELDSVTCDTCTAAEKSVVLDAIAACRARNLPTQHLEEELAALPDFRCRAVRDLRLARLPSVLSLHVQRRSVDPLTHTSHKTPTVITLEPTLDVAPYTTAPRSLQPIPYRLVAVLEHCGGQADAGHYVCYRRYAGSWWWISDAVVKPCEWSTVARCQAYMLFYTKIL